MGVVLQPSPQRTMAKRISAIIIEIASSHVAMLSHPQETAGVITQAGA
jgi:hypothetical protein